MDGSGVDKAFETFKHAAREAEAWGTLTSHQLHDHLRTVSERILEQLEGGDETEPEDIMARLDRQSREIADELKRVERLMRGDHEA